MAYTADPCGHCKGTYGTHDTTAAMCIDPTCQRVGVLAHLANTPALAHAPKISTPGAKMSTQAPVLAQLYMVSDAGLRAHTGTTRGMRHVTRGR